MFRSQLRTANGGLNAAVGVGAALIALLCCGVCVLATAYGAESFAVGAGAVAVVAVLLTMASLELGDDGRRAALPPVLGIAAADTV